MFFNFLATIDEDVLKALDAGWKGYVSLFIALVFIWLSIIILNKLLKKKN